MEYERQIKEVNDTRISLSGTSELFFAHSQSAGLSSSSLSEAWDSSSFQFLPISSLSHRGHCSSSKCSPVPFLLLAEVLERTPSRTSPCLSTPTLPSQFTRCAMKWDRKLTTVDMACSKGLPWSRRLPSHDSYRFWSERSDGSCTQHARCTSLPGYSRLLSGKLISKPLKRLCCSSKSEATTGQIVEYRDRDNCFFDRPIAIINMQCSFASSNTKEHSLKSRSAMIILITSRRTFGPWTGAIAASLFPVLSPILGSSFSKF